MRPEFRRNLLLPPPPLPPFRVVHAAPPPNHLTFVGIDENLFVQNRPTIFRQNHSDQAADIEEWNNIINDGAVSTRHFILHPANAPK